MDKKALYITTDDFTKEYKWIPFINETISHCNLGLSIPFEFLLHMRALFPNNEKYKCGHIIVVVNEDAKSKFEKACMSLSINVEELDLWTEFERYSLSELPYVPSKQSPISTSNQKAICESTFEHIICGEGITQVLTEGTVARKDNIRIYINTNEETNHHIPHCHVDYNNEKNYCVLSLIDLTKIAPDGDRRNAIIKKAQGVLRDNLQDARKMWNSIKSKGKFVFRDGQYTDEVKY